MKSTQPTIEYLRQQILYTKSIILSLDYELRREIEEEEGYLFENARELASLLRHLLSVLSTNVDIEYHRELAEIGQRRNLRGNQDDEAIRRVGQKINEALQVAIELTPILKFVDGARAVANPWGIVSQLDRLCRYLNPDGRVIIRPRWQYNYTYFSINRKLWEASRFATINAIGIKIALTKLINESAFYFSLAFPPTTRLNLLEMAIWAHELGHFVDNFEGMKLSQTQKRFPTEIINLSQDRAEGLQPKIAPRLVRKMLRESINSENPSEVDAHIKINEPIALFTINWAGEIFADLFSVRLFGPAAIFALVDFVQPLSQDLDTTSDPAYPTLRVRLRVVLRQFQIWLESDPAVKRVYNSTSINNLTALKTEIMRLQRIANSPIGPLSMPESMYSGPKFYLETLYKYVLNNIDKVISPFNKDIDRIATDRSKCFLRPSDLLSLDHALSDLAKDLPPQFSRDIGHGKPSRSDQRSLSLLINTGWLYWLTRRKQILSKKADLAQYDTLQQEFDRINSLLMRAVEANEAQEWFHDQSSFTQDLPPSSVGRGNGKTKRGQQSYFRQQSKGIWKREMIHAQIATGKLIIRPLLHPDSQIGEGFIYLRLGNEFFVTRRSSLTKLDPVDLRDSAGITGNQDQYHLPFGKPFVLHPMQFILARTLEYIAIPEDCIGWVTNRTEWAKLGLVATSSQDLPAGFRGQIMLQLNNLGNAPILLYPGARICLITLLSR